VKRIARIYILLLSLIAVFSANSSQASEKAIPFYRNPQSQFPSGELPLKALESTFIRNDKQASYLVERDQRVFWLDADKLLKDTDFPDDTTGYNIISTSLRAKPGWKEDSKIFLPPLSSLKIIGFFENWAHVEFDKVDGFVDANNLLLKADFAGFALSDKNIWRQVLYREGEFVQLDHQETISISKVQKWSTRSDLGIVAGTVPNMQLPLRSHVKIKKVENQNWKMSLLPQHGEVYWLSQTSPSSTEIADDDSLTTEQLMKREINSVAFHPKNSKIGLVSSGGIYFTKDGTTWKKIDQFKNQDFPVTITEPGDFFVGNFRSFDQGKTFFPFLRWDRLTSLIQAEKNKVPPSLKITKLESVDQNQIKIQIDTGIHQMSLIGNPHAGYKADWRVYR
jgi:hypothetical protein